MSAVAFARSAWAWLRGRRDDVVIEAATRLVHDDDGPAFLARETRP